MKEIALEELVIGSCISQDVYNDLGNIILAKGTEITERHIDYFKKHGIDYVYLQDEGRVASELISYKMTATDKYRSLNANYAGMIHTFKNLYVQIQNRNFDFNAEQISEELSPLVDNLLNDNDVLGSMRLLSFNEPYHFTHAVNVAMLSAMLGKWLGLDREHIHMVALAGLLHDVGKTQVPQELLYKSSPLEQYEFSQLKEHAKLGYDLLKGNETISRDVLGAVLFHHERSDGSGYPNGLREDQTPFFARIVAVADVFDAITSDKIYRKGVSSFRAFTIIKDESFRGLDPHISEVFLSNIAAYFVNNKVRLTDGRVGEVVYINKYALNRPLIKVSAEFIDLSMDYSLDIEEVLS